VGTVRELSTEQPVLPNTHITVYDGNEKVVDTLTSNENGIFLLDLPFDQDFIIMGEKDGYETLEGLKFSTRGKPFGIDSLMLPMWKHNLYAKGKIYSNETQEPLEGAVVILENLTDSTVDSVVIGKDGTYAFLALPNKAYRFTVKKDGFLPKSLEVSTQDLVEGVLLNDFVLEGMYVTKEVLRFDYKGVNLTDASAAQLENIYRTLKGNKSSSVFIGAHADARGSSEYNLGLSKNRAASVVDYLVKKGISKERIEAIGFGEQLILNRCINSVGCTNEEHGENRRAEVKITVEKTF
jgi:outer membrane protein OmpA-like peptidoglycan-associated protein